MKPLTRHLLMVALLSFGTPLCAQILAVHDLPADSASRPPSVQNVPSAAGPADTARKFTPVKKSPGTAMLLSAVLPGAGQFYNGSYWKVPIVLGFGIYFVSSWLDNNRRYQDYADKYEHSLQVPPGTGDDRLLALREFYKDQRDSFTWYFLILYLLNLADAYVDASLSDFDVGGDLSIRLMPETPRPVGFSSATSSGNPIPLPPGPRIGLCVRF